MNMCMNAHKSTLCVSVLSEHTGGEGQDLEQLLFPQLVGHKPKDAGANGLKLGVDQHTGIALKLDGAAVCTLQLLFGFHYNCLLHRPLFNLGDDAIVEG